MCRARRRLLQHGQQSRLPKRHRLLPHPLPQQRLLRELLARLSADNLALAVEIARIPEEIRGYGHVKERHLKAARPKWDGLMAQWRGGQPPRHAA